VLASAIAIMSDSSIALKPVIESHRTHALTKAPSSSLA